MKHYFILLIILISFFGCNSKNSATQKRTEIKHFGDSLKIEYVYSEDTVFQNRTYSKGDKVTHFKVKSIWSTLLSENLDCERKIKFVKNNINYTFCFKDVLSQTKKQLKNQTEPKWHIDDVGFLKEELTLIQKGEMDTVSNTNYYMLYHFIKNLDFVIFDQKSQSNIEKIRMENYQSDFSGGHIYYLINKKQDTIAKYNFQDWKS